MTTREALAVMVDEVRAEMRGPMIWGKDDCLMAYADRLHDVLGYDVARPFRGRYRTAIGARRMLKRMGFASIAEAVQARAVAMGWRRVLSSDAQPGDIAVAVVNGVQGCAMLGRAGFWIARGVKGFVALPASAVILAFDPLAGSRSS